MAHLSGLQIHLVFDFILISIIAYYFLNGAVVIEPNVYSSESYFEGCDDVQCDVSNNKEVIDTDVHVPQTPNGIQKEYEFALIADLDIHSRDSDEFRWYSYLTRGTLTRLPNGNFTISIGDTIRISSKTATNNRSMEMSELIMWQGNLIGFCDYTGMVYRIAPDGQVFQRYTIADGNGKESKPFKTEWATKKDGNLYIGSIGKEWVTDNKILHTNAEWIKAMDSCGTIENIDWGQNYRFLREKTNTSYPGYLIHEAVTWHPNLRKWVFLPRRASSNLPYDPQSEERQGTNMLLLVDEEFKNIEIKSVGDLEPLWGFSSVKVVPETNELLVVKVFEVEGKIATKMTVFDVDGNIKLEPSSYFVVSDSVKYEGVEFV